MTSKPVESERVALVRAAGVSVSEADARRVTDSVRSSLTALKAAAPISLFDTEPQAFDVTLRKLANGDGHE